MNVAIKTRYSSLVLALCFHWRVGRGRYGVPFQTFYGISGNCNKFWSISNARRVIGYEPEDGALLKFAPEVGWIIAAVESSKL